MSQVTGISGNSPKEPEIISETRSSFDGTQHGETHYIQHMSDTHQSKDYEPVIGFTREEGESYVHFTLPKRRHGHKHLFYEIMESSAEYGYAQAYGDIVDGYGCTDMTTSYEAADKSQFEPIIGFSKEDI